MDLSACYIALLVLSPIYIGNTNSAKVENERDDSYRPYTPQPLGAVEMTLPSFTNMYDHWHGDDTGPGPRSEKYSIIISSFNAFPDTEDFLFMLEHPGQYLDDVQNSEVRTITQDVNCPREPRQIPLDVFGIEAISQPDGFLIPGKTDGNLRVVDVSDWDDAITHIITSDPDNDWFYHRALWKDMDGDGLKDAVTCRAYQDFTTGEVPSQFVWFRQPGDEPFAGPWETHVISANVCDIYSTMGKLPGGGDTYDVIITTGYFSRQLVVYWSTHPEQLWDDNDQIQHRLIDELPDLGPRYFDLELTDLNADGSPDLLVTLNSDGLESTGSVGVYEIPDDFRFGEYTYHQFADGFLPDVSVEGAGSPGGASTFYPHESMQSDGSKPWIAMSGDDDGNAYYLTPASEDPEDWQYSLTLLVESPGREIIGQISHADTDGDGYAELFVPGYYAGQVYTFKFQDS